MPRKSNISQPGTGEEHNTPAKEKADGVNIEDLSLPRTMVQRLAKGVLPPNTQIQKDAIVAMSKGATVFINHIADKYGMFSLWLSFVIPPRANELALSTNKKTITPQNVLEALSQCEYEDFLPRVKAELDRFNEIATGKRNEYRRKIKEKETGAGTNGSGEKRNSTVNGNLGNGGTDDRVGNDDEGEERARKRVRREEGTEGMIEEKENGPGLRRPMTAGTPDEEDEERYDTAMEDKGAEGGNGDAPPEEDDTELSDDEVEEDERDVSQVMEVGSGLDGRPDGLSSGVDDDDESEDDEEESD
ncbi:MAG: hypothetical protein LQ339_004844 [Xanthoria mediterranea]|nr:MAG: hypothetical protein LQ339_004844 [Xanthoria mediterranea]